MSEADDATARARYFAIAAVRLASVAGAVLGLVLIGRGVDTPTRVLGSALVIVALAVFSIVPLSLARRWRTPPGA